MGLGNYNLLMMPYGGGANGGGGGLPGGAPDKPHRGQSFVYNTGSITPKTSITKSVSYVASGTKSNQILQQERLV